MTDSILSLILRIKKQGTGAKDAEKELAGLNVKMSTLKTAAGALAGSAALGAVVGGLKFAVTAAMDAERVMALTESTIKATGGAAGLTAKQVADMALDFSRLTGVEDETVQAGQNLLLTFKEIKGATFERATASMLDMAVAMNKGQLEGIDLNATAIQLGKALNVAAGDTTAASMALSALTRVGVSFTSEQKQAAIEAVKLGDTLKFQSIILAELESEFGGAAEAAGNTTAGAFAKLKNEVGNLAEALGQTLLPHLVKAAEAANLVITWEEKLRQAYVDQQREIVKATQNYDDYIKQVAILPDREREQILELLRSEAAFDAKGRSIDDLVQELGLYTPALYAAIKAEEAHAGEMSEAAKAAELMKVATGGAGAGINALLTDIGNLNTIIKGELGQAQQEFLTKQSDIKLAMEETAGKIDVLNGKKHLTDAQKTELDELKGTYDDLKQTYDDNATAHEEATKRIVFGFITQKVMAMENKEGALTFLAEIGKAWGLYDDQTAAALSAVDTALATHGLNAQGVLQALGQSIKDIPEHKEIVITTRHRQIVEGEQTTVGGGPAVGLQHGGAFIVPPGFPNDSFPIGVSSGERVIVQPANTFNNPAFNFNLAGLGLAAIKQVVREVLVESGLDTGHRGRLGI